MTANRYYYHASPARQQPFAKAKSRRHYRPRRPEVSRLVSRWRAYAVPSVDEVAGEKYQTITCRVS